ncbi:MAG: SUMF1/EgtB/PvdO family nonheme iron enzyme [Thermoanaerobaculia bacterium]
MANSLRFHRLLEVLAWDPSHEVAATMTPSDEAAALDPRDFQEIAGASSWMGEQGQSTNASGPRHLVKTGPFSLARHEVTVAQFRRFLMVANWKFENAAHLGSKGDRPATFVSWYDAEAFAVWSSLRQGRSFRLPTEAEWELAARGTEGRTYPWGNSPGLAGREGDWNAPFWAGLTIPPGVGRVGSHPLGATPLGIQDLGGGVAEWCLDVYDEDFYSRTPLSSPQGPWDDTGKRSMRGGSFRDIRSIPSAQRSGYDPAEALSGFGFRLVLEDPGE